MEELTIQLDDGQTAFIPGQTIRGQVRWSRLAPPKKARLSLFWYTQGKGDEDKGLVERIQFETPQAIDKRTFEFRLPVGPYSFSGRLISLTWALEVHLDKEFIRNEITVSPSGHEILLGEVR
ncbi:MAG: hypothetical protein GXY41_09590 [Phycisphaerae bacterium]|nr:hypothetical protein [Phycisphaerae bacterium]